MNDNNRLFREKDYLPLKKNRFSNLILEVLTTKEKGEMLQKQFLLFC